MCAWVTGDLAGVGGINAAAAVVGADRKGGRLLESGECKAETFGELLCPVV